MNIRQLIVDDLPTFDKKIRRNVHRLNESLSVCYASRIDVAEAISPILGINSSLNDVRFSESGMVKPQGIRLALRQKKQGILPSLFSSASAPKAIESSSMRNKITFYRKDQLEFLDILNSVIYNFRLAQALKTLKTELCLLKDESLAQYFIKREGKRSIRIIGEDGSGRDYFAQKLAEHWETTPIELSSSRWHNVKHIPPRTTLIVKNIDLLPIKKVHKIVSTINKSNVANVIFITEDERPILRHNIAPLANSAEIIRYPALTTRPIQEMILLTKRLKIKNKDRPLNNFKLRELLGHKDKQDASLIELLRATKSDIKKISRKLNVGHRQAYRLVKGVS